MKRMLKAKRGFTLIELLVVIAIIGLLSSVVLASLNTARYKANDAKRRGDLEALRTALELYYNNHNSYPVASGWNAVGGASLGFVVQSANNWVPGLVADGDISQLPQDPAYPSQAYTAGPCGGSYPSMYMYTSTNGSGYKLVDHCIANSAVVKGNLNDPLTDPVRPTWAWMVCTGSDCAD